MIGLVWVGVILLLVIVATGLVFHPKGSEDVSVCLFASAFILSIVAGFITLGVSARASSDTSNRVLVEEHLVDEWVSSNTGTHIFTLDNGETVSYDNVKHVSLGDHDVLRVYSGVSDWGHWFPVRYVNKQKVVEFSQHGR